MKISKSIKLLLSAILLFAVIFAMSKMTSVSEWYVTNIYPLLAAILSFFSALFPFSLFDIFTILAIISIFVLIFLMIVKKIKCIKALYIVAYSILIIIAWFYFSWGFAYFRQDFYTRCNIQKSEYNADDFKTFAIDFITDANSAYVDINNFDKKEINKKIELQYKKLKDVLKIKYPNGKRKPKRMLYEFLHTKTGVSGYFGPFFNEIHVNNFLLDFDYPFTLAHEKAHQFGIASEAECNLFAFIVCATSNDEQLRYSAYVSTIGYILRDYKKAFPDDYNDLLSQTDERIINDLITSSEHWTNAKSKTLSKAHKVVYDAYLKTNKIDSGIKNYSEVVGLLISTYNIFVK